MHHGGPSLVAIVRTVLGLCLVSSALFLWRLNKAHPRSKEEDEWQALNYGSWALAIISFIVLYALRGQ